MRLKMIFRNGRKIRIQIAGDIYGGASRPRALCFLSTKNKSCEARCGEENFLKIDRNEPVRFLLAGAVINLTDYGVYLFLICSLPFAVSKAISFTCAGIAGYGINRYWIFKHGPSSYAEVGRYAAMNFLALGVNVLINQIILAIRPGSVLFALIAASIVSGMLAFIGFKWWVFRI